VKARAKVAFNPKLALVEAERILALPPAKSHLVRVAPVGALVERFALPLNLCKSTNLTRHANGFALAKLRRSCLFLMGAQLATRRTCPLAGRPQVVAVRFSSRQPDKYADFAKTPVDCLVKLGVLVDDDQDHIDHHQTWEYAPKNAGFVILSVYTGEPS
jgi:hypothetical protein